MFGNNLIFVIYVNILISLTYLLVGLVPIRSPTHREGMRSKPQTLSDDLGSLRRSSSGRRLMRAGEPDKALARLEPGPLADTRRPDRLLTAAKDSKDSTWTPLKKKKAIDARRDPPLASRSRSSSNASER